MCANKRAPSSKQISKSMETETKTLSVRITNSKKSIRRISAGVRSKNEVTRCYPTYIVTFYASGKFNRLNKVNKLWLPSLSAISEYVQKCFKNTTNYYILVAGWMTDNTFFKVLFEFCGAAEDRIRADMKEIRIKTLNDVEVIKTRS